jgi:hypothetical protein
MTELSTEEKRAALAKVEFFAHCSERQLADVAHLAVERDLDAGAELCHEGAFEQQVFVVLDAGGAHPAAVLVLAADDIDSVPAVDPHARESLGPRATRANDDG